MAFAIAIPSAYLIGTVPAVLAGLALRIGDGLNGIPETGGLLDDSVPRMLPAGAAFAGAACQGLIFLVQRRTHGSAIRHAGLDP